MDELMYLRQEIAKARGIALYDDYAEPQAAHFFRIDLKTLKLKRYAGKVPFRDYGERNKRYLGIDIVDYIIFGEHWSELQRGGSIAPDIAAAYVAAGRTIPANMPERRNSAQIVKERLGDEAWQNTKNEISKSGITGSPSETGARRGTGPTTKASDAQSALALARMTLKKPKKP